MVAVDKRHLFICLFKHFGAISIGEKTVAAAHHCRQLSLRGCEKALLIAHARRVFLLRGVSLCHVTRQMLSDKYRLSRVEIFSKRLNKFIATGEFPVDRGDTCHLCLDHGSSLAVINVLMEYETRSLA